MLHGNLLSGKGTLGREEVVGTAGFIVWKIVEGGPLTATSSTQHIFGGYK